MCSGGRWNRWVYNISATIVFSLFYRWYREVLTEPKPQNCLVAINRTQISLALHIIRSCFWGDIQIIERHLDCISSIIVDSVSLDIKYFTSWCPIYFKWMFRYWLCEEWQTTFSSGNCHFKWGWHSSIKISSYTYL